MPTSSEGELPSSDLRDRVLAAVRQQPSPARRAVRVRVMVLSLAALLLPVLAFLALGGPARGLRSWLLFAVTAGGTGALAVAALRLVLGRGRTRGPPRAWLITLTVLGPLLFLIWKLAWS